MFNVAEGLVTVELDRWTVQLELKGRYSATLIVIKNDKVVGIGAKSCIDHVVSARSRAE